MCPGNEIIDHKELNEVKKIFTKSDGVLFAHGYDKRRKNIFRVRDFEKKISKVFGVKYVQCVSSGTAAIKIALKSLGVKPGDEVITQSFNFIATIEAILDCGAKPIITGINDNLNMPVEELPKLITKKTKAIILVHMLGYSGEINKIKKLCKKKNIPLIEDNCEAVGATFNGKQLGTLSDIGIFSFDFGKTITTGEGGCLLTNNKKNFLYFKRYHDHGHKLIKNISRGVDDADMPGFNYRMTELQAAIGISQIKTYDTTFTQVVDFDTPIWFRPVIVNGNVAVNFSIDVVMRIINETDGTQIVKRASLTFDRAAKYAKRMQSVRINSATKLTEVYNTLPNLSANRAVRGLINNSLPKSTRYVPTFIETANIVAANVPVSVVSNDNPDLPPTEIEDLEIPNYQSSGDVTIYVPPFTTYYKFYIAKQNGDDLDQISLTGSDDIILSFEDGGTKKIFNYQRSKDIDLGKGEVLFKVDEANASAIRGMQNKHFYISSKSGSDNTVIAHGKFTIN